MVWGNQSAADRGYGAEWRKLRARILKRDNYLCQCPECKGGEIRVRLATHVDHIKSKAIWLAEHGNLDGVDDPSNLQSMHKDCHNAKTISEKGHRIQYGCDVNGFPLDPNHPWSRR